MIMYPLRSTSLFRPASRPSSPAPGSPATTSPAPSRPDSAMGVDRAARPLHRLTLNNFRRPSPAPAAALTQASVPTLVQDGSYLEMLGLKISEAVSRAFAQPPGPAVPGEQVAGRRPIPFGRGRTLGAVIAAELKASKDNAHIHRAALRCLHRPLSVLLSNLSAYLVPFLASSEFLSPAAPTTHNPTPNATQLHAIALGTFAGEVLETFDDLALGLDGDRDGLKTIRDGLLTLVNRVFNPLLNGIKDGMIPLLEALEHPNVHGSASPARGGVPKVASIPHPSIATLQAIVPIYAKAVSKYTTTSATQPILATFLLSIIWRGLISLSHRPSPPPSPTGSPDLTGSGKRQRHMSSSAVPSTSTPPAGRFTIKLPPSRPPSPPRLVVQVPTTPAADAHALYDLLNMFPRPVAGAPQERVRLAREAVDEAFEGLRGLATLLEAVQAHAIVRAENDDDYLASLQEMTADVPTLIALPVVLRYCHDDNAEHSVEYRSVAEIVGISEAEYRKGCLAGFSRAEECATAVGQTFLEVLRMNDSASVVEKWLEHELAEGAEN